MKNGCHTSRERAHIKLLMECNQKASKNDSEEIQSSKKCDTAQREPKPKYGLGYWLIKL